MVLLGIMHRKYERLKAAHQEAVRRVSELEAGKTVNSRKLVLREDEPRRGDQWDLDAWTRGAGLHRVVAAALREAASVTPDAAPDAALPYLKNVRNRDELKQQLCTGAVMDGSLTSWGRGEAAAAGAATDAEIALFAGSVEMSYRGSIFFAGLEGVVGAPDPNLREAMEDEHTQGHESTQEFTTGNYGVTTTSAKEWSFVVDEAAPDGTSSWPAESEERLPDRSKCRKKTPLAELEKKAEPMNAKLEESNQPVILVEEIIAVNLYTGPVRRARRRLALLPRRTPSHPPATRLRRCSSSTTASSGAAV